MKTNASKKLIVIALASTFLLIFNVTGAHATVVLNGRLVSEENRPLFFGDLFSVLLKD